jgi:hypothetical protein
MARLTIEESIFVDRKPLAETASLPRRPLALPDANRKQTGDAGEYLIAGMMTLAGMPTMVMPDNWPDYDLIAQPPAHGKPQRINVKSRRERGTHKPSFMLESGDWDWLAVVWILEGNEPPRCWLIPREVVLPGSEPYGWGDRLVTWRKLNGKYRDFADNFALRREGN